MCVCVCVHLIWINVNARLFAGRLGCLSHSVYVYGNQRDFRCTNVPLGVRARIWAYIRVFKCVYIDVDFNRKLCLLLFVDMCFSLCWSIVSFSHSNSFYRVLLLFLVRNSFLNVNKQRVWTNLFIILEDCSHRSVYCCQFDVFPVKSEVFPITITGKNTF